MDYAIEFRTLTADNGWNQPALVNGLSEHLKDLTPLDLPSELDALVSLASKIDKRLLGRCIYCAQLGHFLENCPICHCGSARQASVLVCTSPVRTDLDDSSLMSHSPLESVSLTLLSLTLVLMLVSWTLTWPRDLTSL